MEALVLVDIQRDFMPTGALPVPFADEIIPMVNSLMNEFEIVVATQDWHPKTHKSFASNHQKQPFEVISINGSQQVLWPDHCVQNTEGADFPAELHSQKINAIFRKGTNENSDSYSGFFNQAGGQLSGLEGYLKGLNVTCLHIVGVAADYCVYHSVSDALRFGFRVKLHLKGTRAISNSLFETQQKELMKNPNFELIL